MQKSFIQAWSYTHLVYLKVNLENNLLIEKL
jgi:hypothetical protein